MTGRELPTACLIPENSALKRKKAKENIPPIHSKPNILPSLFFTHLMSVSLFLTAPLYSFSQRLHTEERQIVRCAYSLLQISALLYMLKLQKEILTACTFMSLGRVRVMSYLPEEESQQTQQKQAEQDGQNDDPPWHPSILGWALLREHCQPHLGSTNTVTEHQRYDHCITMSVPLLNIL